MPGSPRISRRSILQSGGAAAAYAVGASQLGPAALAQGSASEPRGAAHHRLSLGSREVIVLSDGHLVVPTSILAENVAQAEVKSFLSERAVGPDRVHFHINVALVKPAATTFSSTPAPAAPGNRPQASSPTALRQPAQARTDRQGRGDPRASRSHLGPGRRT